MDGAWVWNHVYGASPFRHARDVPSLPWGGGPPAPSTQAGALRASGTPVPFAGTRAWAQGFGPL